MAAMANQGPAVVFLFAHQDDEMGVFFEIEQVVARGMRPVCFYLTDGVHKGVASAQRCAESTHVLSRLGVASTDMHFVGTTAGIPDGDLASHAARAEKLVSDRLSATGPIHAFVALAYEGGHCDHDATYAIAVRLAVRHDRVSQSRQFTLYRSSMRRFPPYWVFQPLPENGAVFEQRIPLRKRLHYLRLCLSYRSQMITLVGLLPFIVADYVLYGVQKLQPVDPSRLDQRPHQGSLLYERRGRSTYERFRAGISRFALTDEDE